MPTDKQILEIIAELKKKSENLKSIDEIVDFAFTIKQHDVDIQPIQIREEIKSLLEIISKFKPQNILEIGTAKGGTLFLFCKTAPPNSTIISMDLPEGPFGGVEYPDWKIPIFESFREKNQKIHLLRNNSHLSSSVKQVKKILRGEKLDFLFIDGDHSYEGVKQDFKNYSKLVKSGGIIVFHDINPGPEDLVGGVPKFWSEISTNYFVSEIKEEENPHSYGIGILFFEPFKTMSTSYRKIVESILHIQNKNINNFQNKFEKLKNIINAPPILSGKGRAKSNKFFLKSDAAPVTVFAKRRKARFSKLFSLFVQ